MLQQVSSPKSETCLMVEYAEIMHGMHQINQLQVSYSVFKLQTASILSGADVRCRKDLVL